MNVEVARETERDDEYLEEDLEEIQKRFHGQNRGRQNEEVNECKQKTENDCQEEQGLNNVEQNKQETRTLKETVDDYEGEKDLNNVKKKKQKTKKQGKTKRKDKAVNSNEQNPQSPETNPPVTRSKSQNKYKHTCDKCFKSFCTTLGLKRHKHSHCKGEKTKQHACPHCDRNFNSLSSLKVTFLFHLV